MESSRESPAGGGVESKYIIADPRTPALTTAASSGLEREATKVEERERTKGRKKVGERERAKRTIEVDGTNLPVPANKPVTIEQALALAGKREVESVVIDAKVIEREDFPKREAPPTGLITNMVALFKGGV